MYLRGAHAKLVHINFCGFYFRLTHQQIRGIYPPLKSQRMHYICQVYTVHSVLLTIGASVLWTDMRRHRRDGVDDKEREVEVIHQREEGA